MDPDGFHPAVANWFRGQFPAATVVQQRAWRAISAGSHTLISAPTGSGKTLAAFLGVIDALVKRGLEGGLADETRILYVSPLKALSNDINKNLQAPLAGIRDELLESGLPDVCIRALVRTGDTTQSERVKMRRQPPHILVTTPESLYILLTSESGRRMLATVETVIVDEIHALAGNKRGAHLAVSLERLAALCGRPPTRVGVSATTRPMEAMVEFLVGADRSPCQVIDQGHVRHWDLRLELPSSPLEAIMSNEVWVEIYDRLAALAAGHRTTIVFVNTRRLAERVARHLADRCGEDQVTSHHGSLSREHRLKAEERLKAGKLKVLVATASLELGIDIGEVDLVCQLGSPRGIARLLQRVGRSGHGVDRVPAGRLVPLSRDELVECAALLDAVGKGELDAVALCRKPLDVLSQQIVAEVSMREWEVDALFDLIIRSAPFRDLSRSVYLDVLKMLANGFTTQRGRRGAYLHHDRVNGRLRPRRAARLTAVTNGGTIPDQFDYDVTLLPGELFVGTLNEDFAFESMPGDIFQLGNTSYRILKVHSGKVFVEDARGLPPTIPFWFGEAPGRSDELSAAVSRLRREVDEALADKAPADGAPRNHAQGSQASGSHASDSQAPGSQAGGSQTPGGGSVAVARVAERLAEDHALPPIAAEQLCEYLASARAALGGLPTAERIVIERFFDEAGDTHIVVHSPYGSRLNRAWGLALRKRFCRRFNFELQAAALEDTIVISLGVVHSFPLEEVVRYLASATVADVLTQAVLDAPIFPGRWRWNASVALAVRRFRNGKRAPAHFQRTDAEDLLATVFPDQLACAENLAGEREIPDHPLVAQTLQDCLRGVMDIDGLAELLGRIETGEVEVACRELTSPSPLAQEVLSAKPYAFLDDAPAEERRTLAIQSRRHLTVEQAADLGRLDPEAIQRVRSEAWPDFRDEDELHDALVVLGFMAPSEPGEAADPMLERLVADGRASRFRMHGDGWVWVSAERLAELEMAVEDGRTDPRIEALECDVETPEAALRELIRSRMEGLGPVTAAELGRPLGLNDRDVAGALMALEAEGFAMRGCFSERAAQSPSGDRSEAPADIESPSRSASTTRSESRAEPAEEWCDRRLLARIHRYTLKRLRSEIEPVSIAVYQRFLFRWQGLGRERRQGSEALAAVIGELQGLALPAAAWEREILPARLADYNPLEMDELAVSGRIAWYRPMTRQQWTQAAESGLQRGRGTVANSPIVILPRETLPLWRGMTENGNGAADEYPLSTGAGRIHELLSTRGALFFQELVQASGLLRVQTEETLAELVAGGLVTSDAFQGLRMLVTPPSRRRRFHGRRSRRGPSFDSAGRWSLLDRAPADISGENREEVCKHAARALLRRYGVVCRSVLQRENGLPGWRDLLRVFRRLEARGEIRGGRFVGALGGEQFALAEAVKALRRCRRDSNADDWIVLSAADPLNLAGILTPGGRVPAVHSHRLLYRDGVAVATLTAAGLQWLEHLDRSDRRRAEVELGNHAGGKRPVPGRSTMPRQMPSRYAGRWASGRGRPGDKI